MSDFYASVIPTDATWQPTAEAAMAAEAYVRQAFPDPDPGLQEVAAEFHDRITAIDAGEPRAHHLPPLRAGVRSGS